VSELIVAISGKAAALAFKEVVVKSKFWISRMERWSLTLAFKALLLKTSRLLNSEVNST
jgi:hypothetical protein